MFKNFSYEDGIEKGPEFYNHYVDKKSYSAPLKQSNAYKLYKKAASYIQGNKVSIIDIGCGSGRFAKLLYMMGHRDYYGVDFARELVKVAKEYVPNFKFEWLNVFDITDKFHSFDVFICLEILEHIHKDRELLSKIPRGKQVIFSVPNFYSRSHVMAYTSVGEVFKRYEDLLTFKEFFVEKRRTMLATFAGKNGPEKRIDKTKILIFKCVRR